MSGLFRGIVRALQIRFTPTGNIAATNTQDAVAEVDTRVTTLDAGNVKTTGNQTIAGSKTFSNTVTFATFPQINGASGTNRDILFSTSGNGRWRLRANSTTESGSNAGSAFQLVSFDDSAAQIDVPLSIVRAANGAITLARPVSITDTTASTSTTTGSLQTLGGFGCAGAGFFGGIVNASQFATTRQNFIPSGTTQTINWNSGGFITLNLANATGNVTLSLQNPNVATYLIEVIQGATARNIIFPAGALQAGGGGNTYVGVANRRDVLAVTWNGSNYLINSVQGYA